MTRFDLIHFSAFFMYKVVKKDGREDPGTRRRWKTRIRACNAAAINAQSLQERTIEIFLTSLESCNDIPRACHSSGYLWTTVDVRETHSSLVFDDTKSVLEESLGGRLDFVVSLSQIITSVAETYLPSDIINEQCPPFLPLTVLCQFF